MVSSKRLKQERLAGKSKQEDIVARVQIAYEFSYRGPRLHELGLHTARSVHQDADRDGRIQILPEELDWALLAIDIKLEVVLLEPGNITPLLIDDGHGQLVVTWLSGQLARRQG